MLSLTNFRKHIYVVFKMMVETNQELEIVYDNKVYNLRLVVTDKKPALTRTLRKLDPEVRAISTVTCDNCGSLRFNGICMNRDCANSVQ